MRKIDLSNFQAATSGTARDINRRIVLNLVRKHQPISRADVSRQSGLQPSTVSMIAEQLLTERWLKEGAVGELPRGRKPTYLHLNEDRTGIFGINLRPSTTNMVLANLDGRFLLQESMPTPKDPDEFVRQVGQRIRVLMKERPQMAYEGIGVSLPGRVDLSSQRFVFAPNLNWRQEDLKQRLEQATGLPVDLENEANACVLSEFWFGRHTEGVRNLLAVAVSEGIGVGLVLNGQLVRGTSGFAGEFGHVTLGERGPKCACGNLGCWEVYASNSAAVRYFNETRLPARNGKSGSRPAPPVDTFEDLLHLAEQGDLKALETIDRMADYLGRGIAMLVTGLAPEVIVIVGEITRVWDRVGSIINDVARRHSLPIPPCGSSPAARPRCPGCAALLPSCSKNILARHPSPESCHRNHHHRH